MELINSLIEGDCLDVMHDIPDQSIDLILCDLPYSMTKNKWDIPIDLNLLFNQYNRIIKNNGVIALTATGLFLAKLILANEQNYKYKIVWEKSTCSNFLNSKKMPLRKHEDILIFYKSPPTYNPQMTSGKPYNKGLTKKQNQDNYFDFKRVVSKSDNGDRYPTDIIYFKTAQNEGQTYHHTQKPVDLGRYIIRTYTNENDIVLDSCFGSGSFIVAAKIENRRYLGIEKNKDVFFDKKSVDYIKICQSRIDSLDQVNSL